MVQEQTLRLLAPDVHEMILEAGPAVPGPRAVGRQPNGGSGGGAARSGVVLTIRAMRIPSMRSAMPRKTPREGTLLHPGALTSGWLAPGRISGRWSSSEA